jgi:hypothetical protein
MLGLAAATIALVCGCSATTLGTGQPSSGSPTQSGSSSSSGNTAMPGGAPKVKHPLDTTKWQQNPCSTIPASTLPPLGFTAAGKAKTSPRPGCNWSNLDSGDLVGIQFVTDAADGLSTVYENRSDTIRFQPFTIQGYPALIYRLPTDQKGDCSVAVGVTDKLYYQADSIDLASGDPCAAAKTLATAAMATMNPSG